MSDDQSLLPSLPPAGIDPTESWNSDELAAPQQRAALLADVAKRRHIASSPTRNESTFITSPPPEFEDDAVDSVRNPPVSTRGEPARMHSGIEAIVHPAEIQAFHKSMGEGRPGPKVFAYAVGIIAVIAVLAAIVATLMGPSL